MTEVRRLTVEDIHEVHKIEAECFFEPWSEESLKLLCQGENVGVVALTDGHICAYGGMTCVLDEGAVTNIAVLPEYRRQGLGRAVLLGMLDEARKREIANVFLEVRVSNKAAIALYSSLGFFECGVRKGFYRHPPEDALQMVYNIKK